MIQHGSIRGFNLHVAFDQFGNIWNMMKAFVLFMSLWGVKITVWRLCNPKWRRSRHPKSRDNRTQTLQRQDITVIHKTNSCSVFPLSFSQFGCRQPFFFFPLPESQIGVIPPRADRRLLQNTSNGSRHEPRVHCRIYLLKGKRNVNHGLCEKPQN